MFQGLRQHSVIYILDKNNVPTLKIGQVVGVSNPQSKYQFNPAHHFSPPEMLVDVTVKVGEETFELKQLPANENTTNKNGIIVTDSRDVMIAEIENMKLNSVGIIESVPYNQDVIAQCDIMLKDLNPQFAKDKERDDKLNGLETKIGGMETKIGGMYEMLEKFLNQNSKEDKV